MTVDENPTTLRRASDLLAGVRDGTDDDTLAAGVVLAATLIALVWANLGDSYETFWHTPLSISIGDYGIDLDLEHWVNDAVMTLFFFVVGLEVKRELTMGELTDRTRAAVPLVAAIAGLALPAGLFLLLNPSGEAAGAWGVVVSTDTAFVLGALALVGPRCPATAVFSSLRPGSLPPGLTLSHVGGGAALAGIGFTISLFIVDLAIESPEAANDARIGVLLAAVLATALGWALFRLSDRLNPPQGSAGLVLLRPVDPNRDHIRGPVDAPLTLVEYGDFECPFCSKATGSIRDVREHFGDDLRYVFRHLPLDEHHPHARFAAEAAEAAAAQGRFWDMHDHLFAHSDALSRDEIYEHAQQLGLDMDRFDEDLRLGRYRHRVEDDDLDAETSDVFGTPTFYLGATGSDLARHTGPFDAATSIRRLEEVRER